MCRWEGREYTDEGCGCAGGWGYTKMGQQYSRFATRVKADILSKMCAATATETGFWERRISTSSLGWVYKPVQNGNRHMTCSTGDHGCILTSPSPIPTHPDMHLTISLFIPPHFEGCIDRRQGVLIEGKVS